MSSQNGTTTGMYGIVDIGGTKIGVGIASDSEILQTKWLATDVNQGPDYMMALIANTLSALAGEMGSKIVSLRGVGVSVPGPLNRQQGIVHYTGNLQWENYPIVQRLQRFLSGIPVVIDDDANCCGIGEATYGAGVGYRHQVYLTISTGIGGALVIDGNVYRGHGDLAGEVGHMTINPDGPPCSCGNYGCLEALASGTAIALQGRQLLLQKQSRILRDLVPEDTEMTAAAVFAAAAEGDLACQRVVQKTSVYLGIGLANLIQLLNPEAIILGGGVMNQSKTLLPLIIEEMNTRIFDAQRYTVVKVGMLGQSSGLYGALRLINRAIFNVI